MNGLINTLLRLSGVPQEAIDKVEAASPAAAELVKLVKDNEQLIRDVAAFYEEAKPTLDRAVTLYVQARPLLERAEPLIELAAADIEKILPAAQEILALVQKQTPAAPAPDAADRQGAGST